VGQPYQDSIKDPSRRPSTPGLRHAHGMTKWPNRHVLEKVKHSITRSSCSRAQRRVREIQVGRPITTASTSTPLLGDNRPTQGVERRPVRSGVRVPAFAYWKVSCSPRSPKSASACSTGTDVRQAGRSGRSGGCQDRRPRCLADLDARPRETGGANALLEHRAETRGDRRRLEADRDREAAGLPELYDLRADPMEAKNLAVDDRVKLAQLRAVLAKQRKLDHRDRCAAKAMNSCPRVRK